MGHSFYLYAKTHLNKESIIPSFIDSILEN